MNNAERTSTIFRVLRYALPAYLVLHFLPALSQGGIHPQRFTVYDTDGDGYLSREEYLVLVELRRQHGQQRGCLAQQPAPGFGEIDRDRDGRIGQQELTDMLRGGMHRHRGPPWY